jgi:septal ring factor EnvC (AmiA/AmiB activator)
MNNALHKMNSIQDDIIKDEQAIYCQQNTIARLRRQVDDAVAEITRLNRSITRNNKRLKAESANL